MIPIQYVSVAPYRWPLAEIVLGDPDATFWALCYEVWGVREEGE